MSRTNWFKSKEKKNDGYVVGGDEESTINDEMTDTGDVPPKDCAGGDGGRYDQFSEKGGGGYFVQDKDGLNKEGGHWNDDGGEKTGKSKPRTTRTQRGKKLSRKMPSTVSVMFVEQTPGGQLAKLLQAAEDEMAAKTGYRIRVTEMSGSKLCHVMPNTNPWSGMMCGRAMCYPCGQGGETVEDCKRRGILYESSCEDCKKEHSVVHGEKAKKKEVDRSRPGVYVGESGRSLSERAGEHWKDAVKMAEESHMVKHWAQQHPDAEIIPKFTFKVVASFKDALTRQIAEAVRIERRGMGVLNSKSEFSRCHLPRLTIDIEEWQTRRLEGMKAAKQASMEREVDVVTIMNEGGAVAKMVDKRKAPTGDDLKTDRRKKKRKLDLLENWGEKDVGGADHVDGDTGLEDSDYDNIGAGNGVLVALSGPTMSSEVQSSIKKYTIPTNRLMEMMVEQWVQADLLDMVWERLDFGTRFVEKVLEDSDKVMENICLVKVTQEMLSDGEVLAELENSWPGLNDAQELSEEPVTVKKTGYQSVNKEKKTKKAGKKLDNKRLLELAARDCKKMTDWVKVTRSVDPRKRRKLELANQQQEQWRVKNVVSDILIELVHRG